jgi:hypothetical protein|tara:strand:+ start:482 stop:649 length:168 start_codon:yes stop_codon:yes gene_type:complete
MTTIVKKKKNGVLIEEIKLPAKQEKPNAPKRKSKEDKKLQPEDSKTKETTESASQ